MPALCNGMSQLSIGSESLKVRLYVAGDLPSSERALANVREICARHFDPNMAIEVVDVLGDPLRAAQDGVFFTPTLVRLNPKPERFIAGDLTNEKALLRVLKTRNNRRATAPILPRLAGRCIAAIDNLRRAAEEVDAIVDLTGQVFLLANGQEALRHREEQLRALVDAAPDCLITCDEEGQIDVFNAAAEHVFGYKRDEVFGRHVSELVPPKKHDVYSRRLARFLENGKFRRFDRPLILTARHANGSEFRVELTIARLVSSVRPGFGLFIRDLTGRKMVRRSVDEPGP